MQTLGNDIGCLNVYNHGETHTCVATVGAVDRAERLIVCEDIQLAKKIYDALSSGRLKIMHQSDFWKEYEHPAIATERKMFADMKKEKEGS